MYKGKVLVVATYGSFLTLFEYRNLKILKSKGYEIHGASNFNDINHIHNEDMLADVGLVKHQIEFPRSPFSVKNIKAFSQLVKLMKSEEFDLVDTHNPVASVLSRVAAFACGVRPVIYNAHGFFFYEGCPMLNKIVYKPLECVLARITDCVITVNKEDYSNACNMKVRGKAEYIHSAGVDLSKITEQCKDRVEIRQELGLNDSSKLLLSIGELNRNKNHEIVIKSLPAVLSHSDVHYIICGVGPLADDLRNLACDLGVSDRVHLLGQRSDVARIAKESNLYIHPSLKEGLPISLLEAMACGLPAIVTRRGGPKDVIADGRGGYVVDPYDQKSIEEHCVELLSNDFKNKELGNRNLSEVKKYNSSVVDCEMAAIYDKVLDFPSK